MKEQPLTNPPYKILLAGCPTELAIQAVYYPKSDSVLVGHEMIPLQMLNRYGLTAIKPN